MSLGSSFVCPSDQLAISGTACRRLLCPTDHSWPAIPGTTRGSGERLRSSFRAARALVQASLALPLSERSQDPCHIQLPSFCSEPHLGPTLHPLSAFLASVSALTLTCASPSAESAPAAATLPQFSTRHASDRRHSSPASAVSAPASALAAAAAAAAPRGVRCDAMSALAVGAGEESPVAILVCTHVPRTVLSKVQGAVMNGAAVQQDTLMNGPSGSISSEDTPHSHLSPAF